MFSCSLRYLRRHHIGLLALFVALGGTSYAAVRLPAKSVGTKQLRSNAVTSAKVKNASLKAKDFAPGQIPAGPAGAAGARGGIGPQGLRGPEGARGPSDAYSSFFDSMEVPSSAVPVTELAELDLGVGQYVLYANTAVLNHGDGPRFYQCYLGEGLSDLGAADTAKLSVAPAGAQTVSMIGTLSVTDPDNPAVFGCAQGGAGGAGTTFDDIDIGAVRVGALH
jgi:hypothetical protein